ncbi:hypothetical protein DRO60_02105 [Candidatus Bathyarchaeota archaeon]|nr:MAG: hypothetical protein DRO60_02105 [Candidatus Bathyarchaeota archaeon]
MERQVRFGVLLPVPAAPVEKLIRIAKLNEDAGFSSLWVPDHLLFVPYGTTPEAWTLLAALAVSTKKALLGTCVSDPHRRHPAVFAQMVATVDRLSGGRVILGLGAGEAMNLEPFGIAWDRPVSRLEEAVSVMRALWSGQKVDFEGRFWRLKDAFLQIRPVGRVPIYLGAHGPRMLKLTGQLADGWLPTPMTPEMYARRLRAIREAAREAGRDPGEIDTAIYLYTAVAEEREKAVKALEPFKPMIVHSPEALEEAGYEVPELPEGFKHYWRLLPRDEGVLAFMRFGRAVPMEAVLEFSVAGTVGDCLDRLEAYVRAGVRHFVLVNVGPDPKLVLRAYAEHIMPAFSS